jgi:hypothetical protein
VNAQLESPPAAPRFIKIGSDGKPLPADATEWDAVADQRTGRMWAAKPIKVSNWKPATEKKTAAKVAELRLGGFDDWRVPSAEELFLLADRTRVSPAIDTEYFPGCPSDWFWTSTPWASSPAGYAWLVNFYHGSANYNGRGYSGFVRAVRGGQ